MHCEQFNRKSIVYFFHASILIILNLRDLKLNTDSKL